MPPLNLPISFFGRPIKPVSLGFSIFMVTFVVYNVRNTGVFGDSRWGDVIAVVAGAALVLLTLAWARNSQRLAEYGLLLSGTVFTIRGTFLLLTFGFDRQDVYFSLGVAIIAFGSYFLERADPYRIGGKH
jgi:hypothetical protein